MTSEEVKLDDEPSLFQVWFAIIGDETDTDRRFDIKEMEMAFRAGIAHAPPYSMSMSWHNIERWRRASVALGSWMSAALDDPSVCDAMKTDIQEWFSAGQPFGGGGSAYEVREAAAKIAEEWFQPGLATNHENRCFRDIAASIRSMPLESQSND